MSIISIKNLKKRFRDISPKHQPSLENATVPEKIIEFQHGKHIPHNAIHEVLLRHGLAKVNRNKSKRRKPWIRYERKHSLSLVHLDWHTSDHDGKKVYVCVVLDDSSRRILAGGEFDAETTDNSLLLLREAMDRFGCLASIEQVLTDRGTQFYANKRDKNGNADSRFENFLEENKIKHINLASITLKPMGNWKNGTIPMKLTGLSLKILTIS